MAEKGFVKGLMDSKLACESGCLQMLLTKGIDISYIDQLGTRDS